MKARGAHRTGRPHPVDVQVGARLRRRRNALGISQEKLAAGLGVTFQQVQKYERGANRTSASRLYELSRALDVPVSFFFDDSDSAPGPPPPGRFAEPAIDTAMLRRQETIELIDAYYAITNRSLRRKLRELAQELSSSGGETTLLP